ncbi:minor tail protein [Arthrobacter phage Polka]|uniref:Minor tail protein n=1 Tax=Arthrobacter phage Polka TaxID=2419966 RepID=A0A3G2KII9_9CAUD|nr:minor tail protein [Arthrobacter phage Polka]
MAIQTFNKTQVPVGSDPYALTADLKTLAEGLNVVIPVSSAAERDALPDPYEGMTVTRLDRNGDFETYRGGAWPAEPEVEFFTFDQVTGWNAAGTVMLERKGGRKVLSGILTLIRTAGAFSLGTSYANIGSLVPAGARLGSGENLYAAVTLSGGSSSPNMPGLLFMSPVSGIVQVRSLSTFTWSTNALVTATFCIPANEAGY